MSPKSDLVRRRGQITVMFLAGLMTFFGMLAMTVDVGFSYGTKARLQAAVDIGLLLAFAQVNPDDTYEQQVASLKTKVEQFQKANFEYLNLENIAPAKAQPNPWQFLEIKTRKDPGTQRLDRAEARLTARVGTYIAGVFGQPTFDIGVLSVVEGARVLRQDRAVMDAHLVD